MAHLAEGKYSFATLYVRPFPQNTKLSILIQRVPSAQRESNLLPKARELDPAKILQYIQVAKPLNSTQQEKTIENISSSMIDERRYNNNNKIKLLVVDSPITHYRAEYIGRSNLPESHQRLYRFMRLLLRIAQTYEMAVVVTNQIHTTPDSTLFNANKPLGGNVMAQTSTYIVDMWINKLKRTTKLIASPYHKQAYADFHITENGIEDY